MNKHLPGLRLAGAAVLAALSASSVGCYSTAYPQSYQSAPAYTDAKGYEVPGPEQPAPAQPPPYGYRNGINPGWVVAGAAAAGLLGYAIGHNHNHYCGPGYYYGPVPYGYGYGYRGRYGRHWHH